MAKQIERLTQEKAQRLTQPKLHSDGQSLYLQVTATGAKSWVFRFRNPQKGGKVSSIGLGPFADVTVAQARAKAADCRAELRAGKNPLSKRQEERRAQREAKTFSECAAEFIEMNQPRWSNAKHADQWRNTLRTHVEPHLGSMLVKDISPSDVLDTLKPIWNTIPETAGRVRNRIERVLGMATVLGYRQGDNPARWAGGLKEVLPSPEEVKKALSLKRHHPALPWREIHGFVASLRERHGVAAPMLEVLILTATRTNEVREMRWSEIQGDVWVIPASRMKAGKEHRVPLTARVAKLIHNQPNTGPYVWTGQREGQPPSVAAMLSICKALRPDITVHGFRSTFRDWASETTGYENETLELALAHSISNKAEAAYRRGDQLTKRRKLMRDWVRYVEQPSGD